MRREKLSLRNKTPCVNIVNVIEESGRNSRVDNFFMHDQVKIPVVSKTKAKSITSIDQESQK